MRTEGKGEEKPMQGKELYIKCNAESTAKNQSMIQSFDV